MIMQEDNVVGNDPGRGKNAKNPAISYQLATTAPLKLSVPHPEANILSFIIENISDFARYFVPLHAQNRHEL